MMNPIGIFLTLTAVAITTLFSRGIAALSVLATVCYVTQAQYFVFAGFHFTSIRFVLLAAFIRILVRGEFRLIRANPIDRTVILYGLVYMVINTLRVGTPEWFTYNLGSLYDLVLAYLVFRCLLPSRDAVISFCTKLPLLLLPMGLIMIYETLTHRSAFSFLGGPSELWMREGRPRCQGAFRHGITAGVFGATLLPIFVGLYRYPGKQVISMVGVATAFVIVYASNSSGPLMAILGAVIGWGVWGFRKKMRTVRWAIVISLVVLHIIMKPPVWFIFAKMGNIVGGDGWHRSYLIDQTIRHFPDWWLMGTDDTGSWMPTQLANGAADLTNQYVSSAAGGGLAALFLFVLIFTKCFRALGHLLAKTRSEESIHEFFLWGIGCALFSHLMTLFSVTYFDQMEVPWWGFLSIIASLSGDTEDQQAHEKNPEFESTRIPLFSTPTPSILPTDDPQPL